MKKGLRQKNKKRFSKKKGWLNAFGFKILKIQLDWSMYLIRFALVYLNWI